MIALLIAVAAFVLWLELLIRAAAVYVAVLFLPLALATLVWPAISHWCRRLVETLAALILSKFVIVATLSLAAGAISSGTAGTGTHGSGFSAVLAGGALLVMATFVPFAILRMIPAVEAGAVGHLEGLHQRGTAAMTRVPRTAASHALNMGLEAVGDARLMAQTAAAAGGASASGAALGAGSDGRDAQGAQGAVTLGEGEPESERIFEAAVARGERPGPKGPKPVLGQAAPGGPEAGAEAAAPSDAAPAGVAEAVSGGVPGWRGRPYHSARTGPATPEDAWKWEGVPPGRSLIGPVEPGKLRHYMGDDGHGPCIKWLPPAWPPSERDTG